MSGKSISTCLALAVATLVGLLLSDVSTFRAEIFEIEDWAANSLLIQEAKRLALLTGHYSRLGFNHPGPAYLYVMALGELIFHDAFGWVRSPLAGQLIATHALSAAWVGILAWLLARLWSSIALGTAGGAILLAAGIVHDTLFLSSFWLPYLFLLPFAVFVLALSRVVAGDGAALWALVLSAGFLVHGHTVFLPVVGVAVLASAAFLYWQEGRPVPAKEITERSLRWAEGHRATLAASAVFAGIFALPVLLDAFVHFPGEFPKYFLYGRSSAGNPLGPAIGFVLHFWGGGLTGLALFALAVGALWFRSGHYSGIGESRPGLASLAAVVVLVTLLFAWYAKTGLDSLEMKYTGHFYFGAVYVAGTCAVLALVARAERQVLAVLASVSIVLCALAFAKLPGAFSVVKHNPRIPEMFAALAAQPRPLILKLDRHDGRLWQALWGDAVGIAAYAGRRGVRSFCLDSDWHILFSKRLQCTEQERGVGRVAIISPRALQAGADIGIVDFGQLKLILPSGQGLADGSTLAFVADKPADALRHLVSGWSEPEAEFTWSIGKSSVLELQVGSFSRARLVLDVSAFLHDTRPKRVVEVRSGSQLIDTLVFDSSRNRGRREIALPESAISPDGRVRLIFSMAETISPQQVGLSPDARPLGIAVHGLEVRASR